MNFPFFRKKQPPLENLADLHVHILPGLDDGPRTMGEAVRMAEMAVENGIDTVAATPHCLNGVFDNFRQEVMAACEELNRVLAEKAVPLHVVPGAEVRLDPDLLEMMDNGHLMTLNDAGRHLFIELPDQVLLGPTMAVIRQIRSRGIETVIVHPERNPTLQRTPSLMKQLAAAGAMGQATAASLLERFGREAAATGKKMVREGVVQFVASDAHDTRYRIPDVRPVYRVLTAWIGERRARQMLLDTPRQLLGAGHAERAAGLR